MLTQIRIIAEGDSVAGVGDDLARAFDAIIQSDALSEFSLAAARVDQEVYERHPDYPQAHSPWFRGRKVVNLLAAQ